MRPSWKEYFLALAFIASSRSKDQETRHGCIITDKKNLILGSGYNGPIRKINDDLIPKTRPHKYPFFIHSEINAISNCKVNLIDLIGGARAYVTGKPCNHCLQILIQNNIDELYIAQRKGTQLENEETDRIFNFIIDNSKIKVQHININFDWIFQFLTEIKEKL